MAALRHPFPFDQRRVVAYCVEKLISRAPRISQVNQIVAENQA
jgi:hypothetical protein